MSATIKVERLIQQLRDLLNFQYPGAAAESYDSSHDAFLTVTVGGLLQAYVKYTTVPQLASGVQNPVTQKQDTVFVPDVAKVGFDLGTQATGSFTMVGATGEGAVAFGTVTCSGVLAADTTTINGVVFTAVTGVPAANQFDRSGTDAQTAANLAAAVNASATAGVLHIYATVSTNVVKLWSKTPGTGGNAYTLATSAVARLVISGATFSGGTAGSTVVIGGSTFTSVKHADYLVVVNAVTAQGAAEVGLGTQYFDEGAGTAAQAATSAAAVVNASVAAPIANVVTAAVDAAVPAQVDLTADQAGYAGNLITLSKTGTLVTSVSGATLSGGASGTTSGTVSMYLMALTSLLDTEVRVYSKSGIAEADLANDAYLVLTVRGDTQWGFLNQQ